MYTLLTEQEDIGKTVKTEDWDLNKRKKKHKVTAFSKKVEFIL